MATEVDDKQRECERERVMHICYNHGYLTSYGFL